MAVVTAEEVPDTSSPVFNPTRNYTGEDEKYNWRYIERSTKDYKCTYSNHPIWEYDRKYISTSKQLFRTRREYKSCKLGAFRLRFESTNEIGAFIKLTNSFCLLCCAEDSENMLNLLKEDLPEIPIINSTLSGCRVIGRMCVGNKNGLLLPDNVYDTEIRQIKSELPDSVKVGKIEDRLSALGNVIVCNDSIALVHPDIDKESEEIIADTLQVEVFRHLVANSPLVGSYCVLNNHGGLVQPEITKSDLENVSSLLELPLVAGTVNGGSKVLGAGMVVNDRIAHTGMKTTSHEITVIEKVFQLCGRS